MKTKRHSILIFALVISCAFLIYSCGGQKTSNCAYDHSTDVIQNLSSYNKANVYSGHDTLVFVSNAGDTAILYGQGKDSSYALSNSGMGNSADCGGPQYIYHKQVLQLVFKGDNSELNKIATLCYFDPYESVDFTVNANTCSPFNAVYFNYNVNYSHKITINGIDYNCVRSNDPPYVYYEAQLGIIRIDSINGKNWTLNK